MKIRPFTKIRPFRTLYVLALRNVCLHLKRPSVSLQIMLIWCLWTQTNLGRYSQSGMVVRFNFYYYKARRLTLLCLFFAFASKSVYFCKWFEPQLAWNRWITTETTHTKQKILLWRTQGPLMGLQKAKKPPNLPQNVQQQVLSCYN
jgi:hypothetical protein